MCEVAPSARWRQLGAAIRMGRGGLALGEACVRGQRSTAARVILTLTLTLAPTLTLALALTLTLTLALTRAPS